MKKKILAVLLVFGLAGCGASNITGVDSLRPCSSVNCVKVEPAP